MALLEVENLSVDFGRFRAVDRVSVSVDAGDVLGIVGESGSGKSVTMLAVMGLLPWTANVSADRLFFDGIDLMSLPMRGRRHIVGRDMAMIFQEPMDFEVADFQQRHRPSSASAWDRAHRAARRPSG